MTENEMIQELYAKNQIREQLYTYARAVDRIDRDLAKSVFAEHANAKYGFFFDDDAWECMDWICDCHEGYCYTSHQVTNILIKLDGDKASSEAYVTACVCQGTDEDLDPSIARCRYLDKWERRGDKWLIVDRVVAGDISYNTKTTSEAERYDTSRDKDDPSYQYV